MPSPEVIKEEIVECAMDVLGKFSGSKAEAIAERVRQSFDAHGSEVFSKDDFDRMDETGWVPRDRVTGVAADGALER